MFSNIFLPAFICLLARNCSRLSKLAMGKEGLGAEGRRFLRHVCICTFQHACMTFKHGLVTSKSWYESEVQRQGKRFPVSASFLFSKMHSADVRVFNFLQQMGTGCTSQGQSWTMPTSSTPSSSSPVFWLSPMDASSSLSNFVTSKVCIRTSYA